MHGNTPAPFQARVTYNLFKAPWKAFFMALASHIPLSIAALIISLV